MTTTSHRKHLEGFKQTQNDRDISGFDSMNTNNSFGGQKWEKKLSFKKKSKNFWSENFWVPNFDWPPIFTQTTQNAGNGLKMTARPRH